MRPHATDGTGTEIGLAIVLGVGFSGITGASTITSWPSDEIPSADAMRNSRTPSAASAVTVTFSLHDRTLGRVWVSTFLAGGFSRITSAVTPVPSISTL